MQKQVVFILLVAILVAIFALTNAEVVSVRLFFWTYELSGSLLILISVTLGAILVFLLNTAGWLKSKFTIKEVKTELEKTKKQLENTIASNQQLQQEVENLKAELHEAKLAEPTTPPVLPIDPQQE